MIKVEVYGTMKSVACHHLQKGLEKAEIPFEYFNLDEPGNADLVESKGIPRVPTVIVTEDGDTLDFIVGFNNDTIVKIKGYL